MAQRTYILTPARGWVYNEVDMGGKVGMAGHDFDHGNVSVEIKKIKKSIIKWGRDPDVQVFEYGDGIKNSRGGLTHRATVTRDGQPSVLGWKMIRLALMGKSWRYMERVTGIKKANIANLFHNNPVIRAAVLEMEKQIVEDSKALLVRSLRKTTVNLIKIATGEIKGSKVQMSAILELYNRVGFSMPVRGGQGQSGNVVIRLESGEAKDLALLVRSRQDHQLPPPDEDSDEEGGEDDEQADDEVGEAEDFREESRRVVEDESVADLRPGDN